MNSWKIDFMAEVHRQQIVEEMAQIHLENLALRSRVYRPHVFERTMFNFANWMISTGKQLRRRYEIPSVNCSNLPTGSLAE